MDDLLQAIVSLANLCIYQIVSNCEKNAFMTETTLFHLAKHVFTPDSDNESGTKASETDNRRGVRDRTSNPGSKSD